MDTNDLLALLVRYREELRQWLDDEQYRQFLTMLERLRAAGEDTERARQAVTALIGSLWPVPEDAGELGRLLYSDERAVAEAPVLPSQDMVIASLEALYAAPARAGGPATPGSRPAEDADRTATPKDDDSVADLLAAARRRLLAAPSRAAVPGGDPTTGGGPADVIVLSDPDDPEAGPRSPDFQFDPDTGRPLEVVVRINRLLLADRDPWGAADWWLGGNSWLGGAPAALLGRVPDDRLADAARALVEED
ncbi:hypothetical protein AB0G49_07120 [Streptomyces longwoodensis]|uniref:hypothetical protein n=1 Tax=Streptomyces longwoodensis TaxID=68231 RepID=UPI00340DC411